MYLDLFQFSTLPLGAFTQHFLEGPEKKCVGRLYCLQHLEHGFLIFILLNDHLADEALDSQFGGPRVGHWDQVEGGKGIAPLERAFIWRRTITACAI